MVGLRHLLAFLRPGDTLPVPYAFLAWNLTETFRERMKPLTHLTAEILSLVWLRKIRFIWIENNVFNSSRPPAGANRRGLCMDATPTILVTFTKLPQLWKKLTVKWSRRSSYLANSIRTVSKKERQLKSRTAVCKYWRILKRTRKLLKLTIPQDWITDSVLQMTT